MKLKDYIERHGIKVGWLAEKIGISRNRLWALTKGAKPSKVLALRIQDVTNGEVTFKDLMEGIIENKEGA